MYKEIMNMRPSNYNYKKITARNNKSEGKKASKQENEQGKKRTAQDKSLQKGKLNSIVNWKASSTFPLNVIHSLPLSVCLSHAWRAFLALFSQAPPQSHECMSHMPHSHDIGGPGLARGTFLS